MNLLQKKLILLLCLFLFEINSITSVFQKESFSESYFFSQKNLEFYIDSFKEISGKQIEDLRNVDHSKSTSSIAFESSEIKAIDENFFRLKKYWKKHKNDEFIKCRSLLGDFWVKKNKKLKISIPKKSRDRRNKNKQKLKKKNRKLIKNKSNCNIKKSEFVDFIDQNSKKVLKKYGFHLNVCFKFESELLSCNKTNLK